jgi:hypothetical protein
MRKYAHCHDAFTFGESVRGSSSKVEHQVTCVLHLHKLVIEKVLTLLFTRSLDELASEKKTKRIKHIETLQSYVNTLALGTEKNLSTGNVLSRMETRSAIAALQICK